MTLYDFSGTRKSAWHIRYCLVFPLGNRGLFTGEVKEYCLKLAEDYCSKRKMRTA